MDPFHLADVVFFPNLVTSGLFCLEFSTIDLRWISKLFIINQRMFVALSTMETESYYLINLEAIFRRFRDLTDTLKGT